MVIASALFMLASSTPASAAQAGLTSRYEALAPQRILDTRVGLGAPQAQPAAGATVDLKVTGVGGVPATGVTAVTLNVTVFDTRQVGYVQVLPTGSGVLGGSSNINVTAAHQTASNLVTVPVGDGGRVTVYDVAGGHLIADVQGYFTESTASDKGRYQALAPARVLDSRDRTGMPAVPQPPAPPPAPPAPPAPAPPTPPPPAPPAPGPENPGDTKNCTDFTTWAEANAWFWTYYDAFDEDVAHLDNDGDLVPCESLPGAPRTAAADQVTAAPVATQVAATAAFDPYPKPGPGESIAVKLTGTAGVPWAGAAAVALTVTATDSDAAGFVQVSPTGGSTPVGATSNVNLTGPGQTVANLVIVPLATDGTVQLYSSSGTDLIVDVVGYFTDDSESVTTTGLFVPVDPARLTDTRTIGAPVAAGSDSRVSPLGRNGVPLSGVAAVFLNATATQTAGPGYLQVFPTGRAAPGSSSSVNFTAPDQTVATATLGGIGQGGQVSVYTPTRTHFLVDVFGYFTAGPAPAGDPTATLEGLRIVPRAPAVAYDRAGWQHWTDEDGDCQDTRDEVLIAESLTPPVLDGAGCDVIAGTWVDPYTGQTWTVPSDLDVDHVVALKNAHDSGGWAWDAATKRAFANELGYSGHLIAVEDDLNRAKSDSGPEAWRPPAVSYWCQYATDWVTIKKTWTLTVTRAESEALTEMLATC